MSNGLNDYASNSEMREGLRRPFEPKLISKLPATPKRPALDYVSHAAVTDRLNREAPGWTFELTRFMEFTDDKGLPHIMAVYGSMTIGSVTRWEVGEADGLDNYGRELKGAISDFIRRAAMRFGVALDLWAKESIYEESSDTATTGGMPRAAASPPSAQAPPAAGGASEAGPSSVTEEAARPNQSTPEQVNLDGPGVEGEAAGDRAEGRGEGPEAVGTAASSTTVALPIAEPDLPATSEQWERLLAVVGGSMQKAVSRLNRANKTNYTKATAQDGATRAEVANAITGEAA